jgi:hypothetical protein
MIKIGNTIISDELLENFFVCDLEKCKGACCVEGDLGAPLERNELKPVRESYSAIEPYLTAESKTQIKKQGFYIKDFEGDHSTPTINGKECVFSIYDKKGILKCSFEKAWKEGKSEFRKPVSCHLYPVRVRKKYNNFYVNYDRWSICDPACKLGEAMQMPLYVFVKDALIRKFGQEWYDKLDKIAREKQAEKKI